MFLNVLLVIFMESPICHRPFSYSEKECGSNDIFEFSNVHNTDRSSNASQSGHVYENV